MNRKKRKKKKKEFWVIYARCDATNFPRESNNIGIGIKIVRNPKTEQKKEKKLKKKGPLGQILNFVILAKTNNKFSGNLYEFLI